MQQKIKIGIVGGAGYTGGELIRLLVNHPEAEITWVHSKSQAGKPLSVIHQDLWGAIDYAFTDKYDWQAIDVVFLCLGHGESSVFLADNQIPERVKCIDLSQDFRIQHNAHSFVYGLPELQRTSIAEAKQVANPGCFATAIQLALLPLAQAGLLKQAVHIQGITGSTGAGQGLSETNHFSWRNNNIQVYKAFTHQHLKEIKQSLAQLQPDLDSSLFFIPVRGNFTRGILISAYTPSTLSLEEAQALYTAYYQAHPFVHLSPTNPHLKQVVNTNRAVLYLEKHADQLFIICCIDNLLKGASGQAVQNMNLMFGLAETTGLQLKAGYF